MIGQVFGDYRVLEKRGEGGMGMFFKAVDQRLDRIVGLKTLRAELLADPNLLLQLQTEAKSLARLDHQNIARLLHYLVVGDQHFIVMEYVDGRDLAETVKSSGLLPADQLAPVVDQICAAMAYAHAKGVVHRDLKPSNILMTPEGVVKVTDFGIAKILGASSRTRTGMAAGSLPYMAPEQINAAGVDGRTDIYQLGITLFELTTGQRPFVSDSEYEMMRMHLESPPPMPSSINPRVTSALDSVIVKALAKKPEDRYQTALELDEAIQPALESAGFGVGSTPARRKATLAATPVRPDQDMTVLPQRAGDRSPGPANRTPERADGSGGGRRKLVPLAIILAVAALGVVAALLWPRKSAPPPDRTSQGETTAVVQPPVEVSLAIHAQVPQGISGRQVKTIQLTINHPKTGVRTDTVEAIGGAIRSDLTVAPADSIRVVLRGYDGASKTVFKGQSVVHAPAGGHVAAEIALETVTVSADTTRPRAIPIPRTSNLVINVTPFSARDLIERVWIDERPISGGFPLKQTVAVGRHTVRWKIGSSRWTDIVTVNSESEATEKDLFVGTGAGRVTVAATISGGGGYGDIWLDGVSTGMGTPGRLEAVATGPHEFAVKLEGYQMRSGPQIVDVKASSDTLVRFEMIPLSGGR